ncbi:MAG: dipeptidase [Bacteroidales bacterium]|nr:dipeptidase [Bacteroidales bacterium]MBN2750496.1 dipeptidase [Bacteroidales bacterium]
MRFTISLLFFFVTMQFSCSSPQSKSQEQLLEQANKLHGKMVTIDTHTDTPLDFLRQGFDFGGENNTARGSRVDLAKMEKGGLDAAFFAVFIGQDDCTPEKYAEVHQRALDIFSAVQKEVARFPNRAAIAVNPDDAARLKNEGKRAIYIGVENGYPIGTNLSLLQDYYNLGARYVTLSHTRNNQICDSSTDSEGPLHNGVSEFGKEVIAEMNRLGMLVDVSHISDKAFFDAVELSKTPVFASHSCARAICDNPRNLTDEMLTKLAETGGVVQMCILSDYVKTPEPNPARDSARAELQQKYGGFKNLSDSVRMIAYSEWHVINEKYPSKLATVSDVVDHIDHMVKVAGIDHVGIGTDFDGGGGVDGCRDASEMKNITVELLRRGYSEKDIRKIWGENFLRVFRKAQEFAKQNG